MSTHHLLRPVSRSFHLSTCPYSRTLHLSHVRPPAPSSFRRLARLPVARTFSTSHRAHAALATHPPTQPTVLLAYPVQSSLNYEAEDESDEPDVEPIPLEEAKIEMTDRAAEQLRAIAEREHNPDAALRISVESGGCHGYQYKMALATSRAPDDYHFTHPTLKPSNILVDAVSMSLLKGSTIDFATELIGSSFRVLENPQAKGSGCGCGVSWELKI